MIGAGHVQLVGAAAGLVGVGSGKEPGALRQEVRGRCRQPARPPGPGSKPLAWKRSRKPRSASGMVAWAGGAIPRSAKGSYRAQPPSWPALPAAVR